MADKQFLVNKATRRYWPTSLFVYKATTLCFHRNQNPFCG